MEGRYLVALGPSVTTTRRPSCSAINDLLKEEEKFLLKKQMIADKNDSWVNWLSRIHLPHNY